MARGQPAVLAADAAASSSDGDGDDDDDGLSALIGSSFARQAKRQRTLLPDADAASSGEAPGKFAYALHGVTKQPTTGLGARLAGTSNPVDDLWLPASLPWQPADASGSQVLPALLPAVHALRLELRRAARLARLRARFVELCATTSLPSPPVNAFERWRFMCKWQEQGEPSDALLPTGPAQAADASFAADLGRLGVAPAAADQLVAAVRAASVDAVAAVARLRDELSRGREDGSSPAPAVVSFEQLQGGVLRIRAAPAATAAAAVDDEAAVQSDEAELSVSVTEAAVQKLRALHARHGGGVAGDGTGGGGGGGGGEGGTDTADETTATTSGFDARLLALLLRYDAIGGAGFQAALGGGVLRELQASLGVNFECFASPLNAYYGAYCSAFADVDAPFGSRGSFAAFAPVRGAYEVNPPFVDGIIDASARRLLSLLAAAQSSAEPLCFAVVLPGWEDCAGYRALLAAPLLRRTLLVAAADHGYVDGAQHVRPRAYRASTYDTRLFVLQSDAHAAAHPLDDEAMARLETALAECTPSADGPARPAAAGGGARSRRAEAKAADEEEAEDEEVEDPTSEAARRDAPACLRAANPRQKKKRRKKRGRGGASAGTEVVSAP